MPDQTGNETNNPRPINAASEFSLSDLQSLDPALLKELQEQHGLEIQVRSNSDAINRLLQGLGRTGVSDATNAAEFTRGFDRTSPGYDKYYNRDFAVRDPLQEVTLPAERIRSMTLQEALRTLTPEQLATLKRQQG